MAYEKGIATAGGLCRLLAEKKLLKDQIGELPSIGFTQLTFDSRIVQSEALFICKGATFQPAYLEMAREKGASCYLSEQAYDLDMPAIVVKDIRLAMAVAATYFYGHPAQELTAIGITGTKGKTTTAYFVHHVLNRHFGRRTGLLSSVEIVAGEENEEAHLTTPESPELQRLLRKMSDAGQKAVTMEVSSQAYLMERVADMTFDYGVFLNVGEDHIGPMEHSDFEDYLSCKLRFVEHCETMVINRQSEYFERIRQRADHHCHKIITYGDTEDCDYQITGIEPLEKGFAFELTHGIMTERYEICMAGRFNIENAAAAVIICKEMGIDYIAILEGLRETQVMGRMNLFQGEDITVIVDYAHNYVSFKRLYEAMKTDYQGRRIGVVFGCPGGKAYLRRRDIGTLSGEHADYIYLTAEDPQFESVEEICRDIAEYIKPYEKPYEMIADRETAVRKAIASAEAGDVLLITGKGEELYQKVKGEYLPYPSDYRLVEECLAMRNREVKAYAVTE